MKRNISILSFAALAIGLSLSHSQAALAQGGFDPHESCKHHIVPLSGASKPSEGQWANYYQCTHEQFGSGYDVNYEKDAQPAGEPEQPQPQDI